MSDVLARLAATLSDQGGLIAAAVVPDPTSGGEQPRHGALAAAGPRAAAQPAEYELLVEAIREGYLLHYRRGRIVVPDDPDLALLAGDALYALGLSRLAALGDLEAVRVLADVISLAAQAHAAADAELAEAVWDAGAAAVGWGADATHAGAVAAARQGDPAASDTLRGWARQASGGGPGS